MKAFVFILILDGSEVFLGPNEAIGIQDGLKSDIAMCLDECPAADASEKEIVHAVDRTTLWAQRCQREWQSRKSRSIGKKTFGIVQGGRFRDLRMRSAEQLIQMEFPGYAVGGVSVGETEDEMLEQVEWTTQFLPPDKPRYVMGVGTPVQLLKMIGLGVDMFDCVLPSRAARHGTAYTRLGKLNIRNERFRNDLSPLDEEADCCVSREFSKSYLRHLFMTKESLGGVLLTMHNLGFRSFDGRGSRTHFGGNLRELVEKLDRDLFQRSGKKSRACSAFQKILLEKVIWREFSNPRPWVRHPWERFLSIRKRSLSLFRRNQWYPPIFRSSRQARENCVRMMRKVVLHPSS